MGLGEFDQVGDIGVLVLRSLEPVAGEASDGGVGECLQFLEFQSDDLARAMADIHQPADHPQAIDLLQGVNTLTEGIALRIGKTIAALPDTKRVLGKPGIPLDSGYAELYRRCFRQFHLSPFCHRQIIDAFPRQP